MTLLEEIRPGFFELPEIKNMPEDWGVFEEMILELKDFDNKNYINCNFSKDAVLKKYEGPIEKLHEAVAKVDEDWIKFFNAKDEIYVMMLGDEIASFCLIDYFGIHKWKEEKVKIGGPGCVGTVPEFRRQGIGLLMVGNVTLILKERGYDISYIHWTAVSDWYEKLGYQTIIRWNKNGIIKDYSLGNLA